MSKIGLTALLLLCLATVALADTTYVSGAASGVWDTSGSPYIIEDLCYVDSTEILEIHAGTEILFADEAEMSLFGNIKAFGDSSHPVVFNSLDSIGNWTIEKMNFAGDSCSDTFAICIFKNGYLFHGLSFWSYSAQNCVFDNCCLYSSGRLIDCEVCNNKGPYASVKGNETLVNCLIHDNSLAIWGECDPSYISEIPCLYNCTIVDNDTAYVFVDGYWIFKPEIVNCIFARNLQNIEGSFSFENVLFDTLYPWEAYCTTSSDIIFVGDPMFVDPDHGNYHLRDSSIAIGLCDTTCFIPDHDLDGNPRPNPIGSMPDLGCYENPRAIASAIGETPVKPAAFAISAHPNPFNSAVTIAVDGVGAIHELPLQIEIFDLAGRMVAELPSPSVPLPWGEGGNAFSRWEKVAEGRMRAFIWTPDASVTSGVYLVRVDMPDYSASARIVYLK